MIIKVPINAYNGVDGSSLSLARCNQIVSIYTMLEDMGNEIISYYDIQNKAKSLHLFGSTKAENAVRTIFPLLKKIGFVCYDNIFPANNCFSDLGRQFVLAHRALQKVSNNIPYAEEVSSRLMHIKQNLQKMGLIKMNESAENNSHNIWIAIRLLKILEELNWHEFIYTIHHMYEGEKFDDVVLDIKSNKNSIRAIEFKNEKGETLPGTCYSYIRSFLLECDLISNINYNTSKITPDFDLFYSQLTF